MARAKLSVDAGDREAWMDPYAWTPPPPPDIVVYFMGTFTLGSRGRLCQKENRWAQKNDLGKEGRAPLGSLKGRV